MSRSPTEAPRAGLAARLGWPIGRVARLVLLEAGLWDPLAQRLHANGAAWREHNVGRRADIWIAGTELHQLVCAAEVPLAGPVVVAAYARQLFTHYHGTAAQTWPLATWIGPAGRGASALQGHRAGELLAAIGSGTLSARSLQPLWAVALWWALRQAPELAHKAEAKILLIEGALTTRITLREGRCADLQTARLAMPTTARLVEALQAEQAGSNPFDVVLGYGLEDEPPRVDGTRVLGSLSSAGPPSKWFRRHWPSWAAGRVPAPRFEAGAAQRPPGLAWLGLASALAVFATAALQAHDAWQARQLAAAVTADPAPAPAVVSAEGGRMAVGWEAEAAEVSTLAAALHRPWPTWLQGIEAVSNPKIQWLEIEFDAQSDVNWRLRGLAADHPAGLELARGLAQQTDWAGARLARLQVADPGTPVPFEINAAAPPGAGAGR